jgi:hypothetical protein
MSCHEREREGKGRVQLHLEKINTEEKNQRPLANPPLPPSLTRSFLVVFYYYLLLCDVVVIMTIEMKNEKNAVVILPSGESENNKGAQIKHEAGGEGT